MTTNGYRPRNAGEWYELFKTTAESALASIGKPAPRWQPHEFLTLLFSTTAMAVAEIDEAVSAIQDARSIYNASGAYLYELATLIGVRVDPGAASSVTLTVGAWGTGSVLLSKGSRAQGGGSTGLSIWETTDDVLIPAGGTATVSARCTEVGAVQAASGTITRRISGTTGWVSVTNADAASPGYAADTEDQIRSKILSFNSVGSRSPLALKSTIERATSVRKAYVYFNDTMSSVTMGQAVIPACGVAVWIWPEAIPNSDKQQILRLIYAFKDGSAAIAIPANSSDGASGEFVGADGLVNTVGYFYVQPQYFKVNVTITAYEGTATLAKVSSAVQSAVSGYFNALGPGDDVRQNDIIGAVASVIGVGRATVTLAYTDPGDDPTNPANFSGFSSLDKLISVDAIATHYQTTVA
jgi:hypothetical protein